MRVRVRVRARVGARVRARVGVRVPTPPPPSPPPPPLPPPAPPPASPLLPERCALPRQLSDACRPCRGRRRPTARPRSAAPRAALRAPLPVRRALAPALATSPSLCAKQVRGARGSPLRLAWARVQAEKDRRPETGGRGAHCSGRTRPQGLMSGAATVPPARPGAAEGAPRPRDWSLVVRATAGQRHLGCAGGGFRPRRSAPGGGWRGRRAATRARPARGRSRRRGSSPLARERRRRPGARAARRPAAGALGAGRVAAAPLGTPAEPSGKGQVGGKGVAPSYGYAG